MSDNSTEIMAPNGRWAGAWAVILFVGLTLLLRLPEILLGTLPWNFAFYWEGPLRVFSLDLFALVSLLALVPRPGRVARCLVAGSILVLLAYETYEAVVEALLRRNPLFTADGSHVVGGVYLVLNAGRTWHYAVGIAGAAAVGALLWWGLPWSLDRLHRALRFRRTGRGLLLVNLVVWPLVAFAAITNRGIERQTYQEICLSTTECIIHNARASVALTQKLADRREAPPDSTYAGYAELDWQNPPGLYLVVLESYGSVLRKEGESSEYSRLVSGVETTLRPSGWHAASAQSEAPVFGGLSWLSVATMLLGTPVDHQPTFELLRPTLPRYPHLVHTLRRQGYRTGLLQPPVRKRPGMSVDNVYGFDRTFYLEDLDYQGPEYGWGIVPDQYSLSVAHERFVTSSTSPFFLLFETVAGHAPWNQAPPPLLANPRDFNESRTPSRKPIAQASDSLLVDTTASSGSRTQADQLLSRLRYDWRVLANYLREQAPENSLVVVLGDHQPYFAEGGDATPLHVLSRDEALVRRFQEYGFVPGLYPSSKAETLHHAGLYSLLVRVLTAHDRATTGRPLAPLPPYRPQGVQRAAPLSEPQ